MTTVNLWKELGQEGRFLMRSISALPRDRTPGLLLPCEGQGEVRHLQLGGGSSSQSNHAGLDLRIPAQELGEIISYC